jgi:cupin fold WbuC family metalloprotein
MSDVQLITEELFERVAGQAAASARKRMNHNFHDGPADNPHRFLNILLKGAYIRPHRHVTPPKTECFLVLEGEAELIIFDASGSIQARHRLGGTVSGGRLWGVDIAAGVWHTVLPITDRVVCFEVKPGPWHPSTDKDFASWAPAEGTPEVAQYASGLLAGAR